MPKMRQFYLWEQWTYVRRAARLGRRIDFLYEDPITPHCG